MKIGSVEISVTENLGAQLHKNIGFHVAGIKGYYVSKKMPMKKKRWQL